MFNYLKDNETEIFDLFLEKIDRAILFDKEIHITILADRLIHQFTDDEIPVAGMRSHHQNTLIGKFHIQL